MKTGFNTKVLNEAKRKMIDFANGKGISLADEFASVEQFNQFVISYTIKTLVDSGIPMEQAYDFIFGEGQYKQLAESVWNKLNANAATVAS